MKSVVMCSVAALVFPLLVCAQANLKPLVNKSDRMFLRNAAEINLSEIYLGELAQQNASAAPVKAFADRMVTDHSNAQHKLTVFAARENVILPDQVDAKDMALYARLAKLSGPDFDRGYINAMVQGHTQAVDQFKNEAKTAASSDVRTFATQTLPMPRGAFKTGASRRRADWRRLPPISPFQGPPRCAGPPPSTTHRTSRLG